MATPHLVLGEIQFPDRSNMLLTSHVKDLEKESTMEVLADLIVWILAIALIAGVLALPWAPTAEWTYHVYFIFAAALLVLIPSYISDEVPAWSVTAVSLSSTAYWAYSRIVFKRWNPDAITRFNDENEELYE